MRRPNFTLLSETEVLHAVKHDDGKTVKGVKFITKEGVEGFQPADVVCITTYQMDNVRLMLLSRVGEQYAPPARAEARLVATTTTRPARRSPASSTTAT